MLNNLVKCLLKIKNNQSSKKKLIFQKKTKIIRNFLKFLWDNGYILGYKNNDNSIKINLKYFKNKPIINSLKIIYKSNNNKNLSKEQLWKLKSNKFYVFLTSCGFKSLIQCRKENISGKLILIIN